MGAVQPISAPDLLLPHPWTLGYREAWHVTLGLRDSVLGTRLCGLEPNVYREWRPCGPFEGTTLLSVWAAERLFTLFLKIEVHTGVLVHTAGPPALSVQGWLESATLRQSHKNIGLREAWVVAKDHKSAGLVVSSFHDLSRLCLMSFFFLGNVSFWNYSSSLRRGGSLRVDPECQLPV